MSSLQSESTPSSKADGSVPQLRQHVHEHLQRTKDSLQKLPSEITDGVPILLQNLVGPISRALEQAFQTDAKFIDALMQVRTSLQQDLEATIPVSAVAGGEDSNTGESIKRLTAKDVDEALRK